MAQRRTFDYKYNIGINHNNNDNNINNNTNNNNKNSTNNTNSSNSNIRQAEHAGGGEVWPALGASELAG